MLMAVVMLMPLLAVAQTAPGQGQPPDYPLSTVRIIGLVKNAVNFLILLGGIIAVLYIVVAGFKYIFAGGDPEAAGKARTMLWNGLIGLVIIIGAYVIARTVEYLLLNWLGQYGPPAP